MEITSPYPLSWLAVALFLAGAPLYAGIVNKLKARLSGRFGASVFQPYYELWRLAQKETVYSTSAGFISRIAPVIVWCTVVFAALLLPLGCPAAALSFSGDLILFAYLLALGRFFQILAALDSAASLEGMGASREARFAVFAEPIFFFTIGSLAIITRQYSFETILAGISWSNPLFVVFISIGLLSLFFLMMAECSRMPVDDPNTHLELTMIHEVMILDASGFDLMLYQYAASLKLLLYSTLAALLLNPFGVLGPAPGLLVFGTTLLGMAAGLALVETLMARFRLVLVPQFLLFATAIGVLNILIFTFSHKP
jgi:formate hydrogenlyase subunit 4